MSAEATPLISMALGDMPWHVPTAMSAFLKLVTLPDDSASRVLLGQDAPLRWIEIIGARTEIFNKPERV